MSAPTGLVLPVPGREQPSWLETFDPRDPSAALATLAANTAYLSLIRPSAPIRISSLVVEIGGASGNIDFGVFTSTDASTFTLLASTGSTASAGTNALQTIALTSAVTLTPGISYWFSVAADNAIVTILRLGANANHVAAIAAGSRSVAKGSLFPLATFSSPSTTAVTPWIRGV